MILDYKIVSTLCSRIVSLAIIFIFSSVSLFAAAQDYYFIEHKPTDSRMQVCAGAAGTPVSSESNLDSGVCAQFELVTNGDYFHIRSVNANMYLKPDTAEAGSPVSLQPLSYVGNWTQWSFVDTGDGYGHLVNRGTGKQLFLGQEGNADVLQQPTAWQGDFTRWRFVRVDSASIPPVIGSVEPDSYFIQHKPSGNKMHVCAGENGTPVSTTPQSDVGNCSEFEVVANGDYFHIRSIAANRFIKPDTAENGSPISLQPLSFRGNWTQWSYEQRGDGYGHIINRGTGKLIFVNGTDNADISQQPSSWRGDFTRWAFVSLNDGTDPISRPTAEPTAFPTAVPTALPTSVPTALPIADTVAISSNQQFPEFLIGGESSSQPGFTLYTFANDNGGPNSVCNDGCALTWPPLLVESETNLVGPSSLNLGTTVRNDGSLQVTYNNEPLYFYREDNNPGDTNGHNAGGVWFVAQVEDSAGPDPISTSEPTVTSAPQPIATPSCNAPSETQTTVYEAELGEILGSASIYDDGSASGGQGVAFISTENAGFRITTDASLGQSSSITLRYTSEQFGQISYRVEGADAGNIDFSATGAWVGQYQDIVIDVSVPAGGTFDIFFDTGDAAMNVDKLTVTSSVKQCGGTPGPTQTSAPAPGPTQTSAPIPVPTRTSAPGPRPTDRPVPGPISTAPPFVPTGPVSAEFSNLDFTSNSHPGDRLGPPPRANRPDALGTPINGAAPPLHGFAFDIEGDQLTWRWGMYNFEGNTRLAGDAGLEMHCSEDNNQTFKMAQLSNSRLTIPCSGTYTYFFRYKHPVALSSLEGTEWLHTGLYTSAWRVDVNNYESFTDGSANWMRWRHPVAHDGCTAAISDACHNFGKVSILDRYNIWIEDSPGNVEMNHQIDGGIVRVEALRHSGSVTNGQQQFAFNRSTGFGDYFAYGQVIAFEITATAGSQVYNDFSYYTVGLGWGNYGDPRLNMAGRAGTTMIISGAPGNDIFDEQEAIFTQPMVTVHDEGLMNDFIIGHHLFHGIDPNAYNGDHDQVKIGERSCGNCHFRDGRGSEVIDTPRGPRLPPPVYGIKLLEWMEGREAGFRWDGGVATVEEQILNAFREDHNVDPNTLPPRVLETIVNYTEVLTVPSRRPAVYDDPQIARGDILFSEIGCADCHLPEARTRLDAPSYLRDIQIRPYTDMKLWDLGEGDFRTPALWGLSHNLTLLTSRNREVRYMHDGASRSISDAIGRHGAQAAQSRSAYNGLSGSDKAAIVEFVESL